MLMAKRITCEDWLKEHNDFEHKGGENVITAFEMPNVGAARANIVYSVFCEKYKDEDVHKYKLYCYLNKKLVATKRKDFENNPILDNAHSLINSIVMERMFEDLT